MGKREAIKIIAFDGCQLHWQAAAGVRGVSADTLARAHSRCFAMTDLLAPANEAPPSSPLPTLPIGLWPLAGSRWWMSFW